MSEKVNKNKSRCPRSLALGDQGDYETAPTKAVFKAAFLSEVGAKHQRSRRIRGCSCRCSFSPDHKNGCPIQATSLSLSLGWDATNANEGNVGFTYPDHKNGCPILATSLFLSLWWETTNPTQRFVFLSE